jgi:hypothetical protein
MHHKSLRRPYGIPEQLLAAFEVRHLDDEPTLRTIPDAVIVLQK